MQTTAGEISLHVSVAAQTLEVRGPSGEHLHRYPVSTSRYGLGSEPGSLRTPTGSFRIAEKIGGDAPLGTVFKSRASTGEICLHAADDDLVLTRILWLDGLEPHNANTYERYIYIHGTNHESQIGQPASHGCVRMRNADVVELYNRVKIGTKVEIQAVHP